MGYDPATAAAGSHAGGVNMIQLQPAVVTVLQKFDYPTRALALRVIGSGDQISAALNDVLAHEKCREVLICLAHCAHAGLLEYYRGDDEIGPLDNLKRACARGGLGEHGSADRNPRRENSIETYTATRPAASRVRGHARGVCTDHRQHGGDSRATTTASPIAAWHSGIDGDATWPVDFETT
jgi:hypothetical protein